MYNPYEVYTDKELFKIAEAGIDELRKELAKRLMERNEELIQIHQDLTEGV